MTLFEKSRIQAQLRNRYKFERIKEFEKADAGFDPLLVPGFRASNHPISGLWWKCT